MKKIYFFVVPLAAFLFHACAFTDQTLNNDVNTLKVDVADIKQETRLLQEMNKNLQQRLANSDLRIDDEVKSSIQELSGQVNENQFQVKKSLKGIEDRLAKIEAGRIGPAPAPESGAPSGTNPLFGPPAASQKLTLTDPEEVYAAAYDLYKETRLEEAREAFRKFLNQFPQTEYSDNAQFWVAECFFREGKYEQAILAYEDVVKKYPKGNKVPDALLKQGICFGALGDRDSSRILLQRVIETYPESPQAEIARRELQKLS